jgi:hypothetical protein
VDSNRSFFGESSPLVDEMMSPLDSRGTTRDPIRYRELTEKSIIKDGEFSEPPGTQGNHDLRIDFMNVKSRIPTEQSDFNATRSHFTF